jgi:hypothetical protein
MMVRQGYKCAAFGVLLRYSHLHEIRPVLVPQNPKGMLGVRIMAGPTLSAVLLVCGAGIRRVRGKSLICMISRPMKKWSSQV